MGDSGSGRASLGRAAATRRRRAVLAFVFLPLLLPASAAAVTSSVEGGVLKIVDEPGRGALLEVNRSVGPPAAWVVVTNGGPNAAGPGCRAGSANGVVCDDTGITRIEADLGDGDDQFPFHVNAPQPTIPLVIRAGPGTDRVQGGPAADSIDGGPGYDEIDAADGDDVIDAVDDGWDDVLCGAGQDTVRADPFPAIGRYSTDGAEDSTSFPRPPRRFRETIEPAGPTPNATVHSAPVTEIPDMRFFGAPGTESHLTITADGKDVVFTEPGGLAIYGFSGSDDLPGGPPGCVRLTAGDKTSARCGRAGPFVHLGDGNDTLDMTLSGRETIVAGYSGDDVVRSLGASPDLLSGGSGRDVLEGGGGDDEIYGGPGRDRVRCGAGTDRAWVQFDDEVARTGAERCERIFVVWEGYFDRYADREGLPGAACGQGQSTQCDGELPLPQPGKTANVRPVRGTVSVKLPGTPAKDPFTPLIDTAQLPVGTIVDTTKGTVAITAAADLRGGLARGEFYSGQFKLSQKRASKPVTELTLTGGSFGACPKGRRRVTAAAGRARRLWGNARGRFRTRGRNSTASVRGTTWLTEDRCDGTLTRVRSGTVVVRDLILRRNVTLKRGKSYLARRR